jgi:hypothetical protein
MIFERVGNLYKGMVDAVKSITRGHVVIDGVIAAVDTTNFTADVTVGDSLGSITYYSVPLRVLYAQQASVIEIPNTGSACIICFRDGNLGRPQLLMVHSTLKLLVNCSQVIFNNGNKGGLVNVNDLVIRLNNIENDINSLKTSLAGWTPVPQDGGAALKAAAGTWFGKTLTPTVRTNI